LGPEIASAADLARMVVFRIPLKSLEHLTHTGSFSNEEIADRVIPKTYIVRVTHLAGRDKGIGYRGLLLLPPWCRGLVFVAGCCRTQGSIPACASGNWRPVSKLASIPPCGSPEAGFASCGRFKRERHQRSRG